MNLTGLLKLHYQCSYCVKGSYSTNYNLRTHLSTNSDKDSIDHYEYAGNIVTAENIRQKCLNLKREQEPTFFEK